MLLAQIRSSRARASRGPSKAVIAAAGIAVALAAGIAGLMADPATARVAAAANATADEPGPPPLEEDYSYPGGDAVPGITLIKGDGHILAVACATDSDQIKAVSLDEKGVSHDFCFQVRGDHGYLTLSLKGAYLVWADRHTVQAKVTVAGESEIKTVQPHDAQGVGIGEHKAEATLVELRV